MTASIEGYTYGTASVPASPVSAAELSDLQASVLWSDADRAALRRAREILAPQTEAVLDVWYGFVGANPHLVATFAGADGQPDPEYLGRVRARFGQWIVDLCGREYDERWLAYQDEIARRHHPTGKNRADAVASQSGHVPLRHLIALIVPITVTIRDFLAVGATDASDLEEMYQAWFKAVTLSVVLWARPYSPDLW